MNQDEFWKNVKAFSDLGDLPESARIKAIGKFVMGLPANTGKPQIIGIALEDEAKARRYEKKLLKRFPTIKIHDISPGPVPGTVLLRIGPPQG